ncbi:DNA helicase RecQ [Rhizophagus clarus]|uniref:DNA 3'-5' helicase n=1 Tax=Rhizophagus clarus TaxID=94130 RepID=A0A8H3L6J3_9GLOM|nr:DNA helicase RecQ [Rhizophagus clarus]
MFKVKTTEYKNETYQNNFGILVSGAGIAGGANCQQMKTIFSTVGVTSQIVKKTYHNYQKKFFDTLHHAAVTSAEEALEIACSHIVNIEEKVLPVSFDVSWSHVRNANQASGELILQKNFLGNFDKSSHQMEHAILIEVLEKIQPNLDKYDLMLDIGVDGDLNSNKTLSSIRSVNKIYGDLKHIGKNIRKKIAKNAVWKDYENVIMKYYTRVVYAATARKEDPDIETPEDQEVLDLQINGLVAHLSGDHSLCWEEFCWHKSNIDLELPEPNLLKHDNNKCASFKSMLIEVFHLPTQQSLITTIRTSYNEAFNRLKLCYTNKLIDYYKSYQARHACAILHNNYGIDILIKIMRSIEEVSDLSVKDYINLKKMLDVRQQQRQKNQKEITQCNEERGKKIDEQKKQTETFDFDQDLVPYGKNVKFEIETHKFIPSFSHLIRDFISLLKCHACLSFPKYSSIGLCKVYYFYLYSGLQNQFPNRKYTLPFEIPNAEISIEKKIDMVVNQVFEFSGYREKQYESIMSFINEKNTLVILPTGSSKTMCWVAPALISEGLTVVFTPLKALIDDQIRELINIGIPCAGLYTSTSHPSNYQEKVFGEIAVDEAHCIVEQEHFRKAWKNLGTLKQLFPLSPLMLLTATCSTNEARKIQSIMNIQVGDLNIVRCSSFVRSEITFEVQTKSSKERTIDEICDQIRRVENGYCIVYCSLPASCEEVLELIRIKLESISLDIYHGKLESIVRHQPITCWKAGLTQVIVATNAFGLGINMPNVRLVIHYTFPLSLGNLIQEAGRAGRDRREAKHIIYYSRQDIKTVYGIVASEESSTDDMEYQEYLEEKQKKILEIMLFCESQYECRQKLLVQYYSWDGDEEVLPCEKCDNCLRRQNHCPIIQDARQDALYMLQVVDAVTNYMKNNIENTTRDDIVQVFCRSKSASVIKKKLNQLDIYKENYKRILKRQEEVAYLLEDLAIRGLVKVKFKLSKPTPTSQINCNLIYIGVTENAIERASIGSWLYFVKNRQK